MKTRVFFVRHAQSEAAVAGVVQGRGIHVPLSDAGMKQAKVLAETLKDERFDLVVASNALRSIATAQAMRVYHSDTPYLEIPELIERSKGVAEGIGRDDFRARWPDVQAAWDRELDARPPGGENFEDVHARVVPVIEQHLEEHAGKNLLYVLHGNVNRVLLGWMLNVPYRLQSRIEQGYCAINVAVYDHERRRWSIECINRIPV